MRNLYDKGKGIFEAKQGKKKSLKAMGKLNFMQNERCQIWTNNCENLWQTA